MAVSMGGMWRRQFALLVVVVVLVERRPFVLRLITYARSLRGMHEGHYVDQKTNSELQCNGSDLRPPLISLIIAFFLLQSRL